MCKQTNLIAALAVSLCIAGIGVRAEEAKPEQRPETLGNLTCSFGENVEAETFQTAQAVVCVFRSTTSSVEELYEGTAYFSGPPGKPDPDAAQSWIVKGSEDTVEERGSLGQIYAVQSRGDPDSEPPLVGKQVDEIGLYPLGKGDPADSAKSDRKIAVIELKLKTTVT